MVSVPVTSKRSAPVRAMREAAKDPRRSVEERYRSRDDYLAQVEKAADALVLRGYLLFDDLPRVLQRATDTWDTIVGDALKQF